VLYLLLVRMRSPRAIPHTLAVLMAVCCGWCWPSMLAQEKPHRDRAAEVGRLLARGNVPLSGVWERCYVDVGFPSVNWVPPLIDSMMQLRQSDQSIFHAINRRKRRAGAALPQAWKADAGQLGSGWEIVADGNATQGRTLRVRVAGEQP